MTILEKMYNGKINIIEKKFKKDSEYAKIISLSTDAEKELYRSINKQQKKLYQKIIDLGLRQEDILLNDAFSEGFRIGAQIMLELFSEPKSQFEPTYKDE